MGFQIANDADSVSKRASSATGFIDEDLPLLRILRVVEKKKGAEKVNNNKINRKLLSILQFALPQKNLLSISSTWLKLMGHTVHN